MKCLNQQQLRAVSFYNGPCMVYAGPGSGKTTVIAHRIKNLIERYKVPPTNILVISFTKASAEEMKCRFDSLMGDNRMKGVSFGTFHSVFFKIIRDFYGYTLKDIVSEGDKYKAIKNIIKTLGIDDINDEDIIKDIILDVSRNRINIDGNEGIASNSVSPNNLTKIMEYYENYKQDCKKIDFDDMMIKCYNLIHQQPQILEGLRRKYKYILVDEFQDINHIQFHIIKQMAAPRNNLFVVGDDDQSIYSFRGSKPDFILTFHDYFNEAEKILINKNYRSQGTIIEASNALISNNRLRIAKSMIATKENTSPIYYLQPNSKKEENEKVVAIIHDSLKKGFRYGDITIIYRTNLQANGIIQYLVENEIPFFCKEKPIDIYHHWVVKDVFAYLEAGYANNFHSLEKVINRPSRYISKKSIEGAKIEDVDFLYGLEKNGELLAYQHKLLNKLKKDLKKISTLSLREAVQYIRKEIGYDEYIIDYCRDKELSTMNFFEVLDELQESISNYKNYSSMLDGIHKLKQRSNYIKEAAIENAVALQTIHRAKGLEYGVVIVIDAIEGIIPYKRSTESEEALEEERRLFYVAITRAKESLYILSPKYRYGNKVEISRFVYEMQNNKETYDKMVKRKYIFHKIFGKGRILSNSEKTIKVAFGHLIKELDLETCIKNNILRD